MCTLLCLIHFTCLNFLCRILKFKTLYNLGSNLQSLVRASFLWQCLFMFSSIGCRPASLCHGPLSVVHLSVR